MYRTWTMRHVQSVKLRKKAKKRPNIPKNPIFSMNLEPSIWFLKSRRMKVRGDKPYASSSQGSFKRVPTLKNSLVSFDFVEVHQDRQEARIGKIGLSKTGFEHQRFNQVFRIS